MGETNSTKRKAKDRDGLYRRRGYWHFERLVDGKKRSFTTGTKDHNEAKRKRAETLRAIEQGKVPSDSGRKRLEIAAAEYIAYREATVSPGTVRIDKERLPALKRIIGNRMLSEISARSIREYQATKAKEVSPRTVNLEIKLLRGILKAEGQWRRLSEDVKPLKESGDTPGRALTPEESLKLFQTAQSRSEWLVAYLTAVVANDTGMRGVELRNLRIGNIDLDSKAISIGRSKTDAGLRQVILTNDAIKAMAALLSRAASLGATTPEHYLIPRRVKGGYDPTAPAKGWRTAWRSLRKTAGLKGFRFHDLRHTHVTTHAEIGTPLPVLMQQVGHLSPKMTKLYTHISQKAMQKAAEEFERAKAERLAEAQRNLSRMNESAARVN